MTSLGKLASFALALTFAAGCGSTASDPDPGDPGGTAGPSMFACEPALDCTQDTGHLGEITDADLRCGGELYSAGSEGAVLVLSNPGPYPTEIETLVVLLGDGQAYVQTRSRCSVADACAEQNTADWALQPVQLCDVIAPEAADVEGCDEPEGVCAWVAYATNCAEVTDTFSCDGVP